MLTTQLFTEPLFSNNDDVLRSERDIRREVRASMTRRGYKLRDSLDLYFMENRLGLSVNRLRPVILRKIDFMLDLYLRYRENIELSQIPRVDLSRGQEMMLLLDETPSDLRRRVALINGELEKLRREIVAHRKSR